MMSPPTLRTLHPAPHALCTPHSAPCTLCTLLHQDCTPPTGNWSQNQPFRPHYSVVGYQTKTIDEHYNWTCNTFKNVDGSNITLANFKVDADQFISTMIEFFDKDGAVNTINDPDVGDGVCEQYFYLPAEYAASGEDGWYLIDDNMGNYNRKDRVITFGESFVVDTASGEEGAPITFAGQVSNASVPVTIEEHYNWLGNCAPKEITLSDLTVDGDEFISSMVEFFDKDGAVKTINDPDVGDGVCEQYFYLPAAYAACGEDGWYLIDDNMGDYNRKDRVIGAGEGFVVDTASGEEGAVITLPSAL